MNHTEESAGRQARFGFALLYFSEGGPIGFVWWAIPAWLSFRGVDVAAVTTVTSWAALVWAVKFLWAPLVDRRGHVPGTLKRTVLIAQAVMIATILAAGAADAGPAAGGIDIELLTWALVAHAVAAATQDVAIDALAIRSVPESARGRLNGWMQAGMLLGRGLFAGGAIALFPVIGLRGVVMALAGAIALGACGLLLVPDPATRAAGGGVPLLRGRAWLRAFGISCLRPVFLAGAAFALTAGAAFESFGGLASPFLISSGAGAGEVAIFFGVVVLIAMGIGCVLGGRIADRLGAGRAMIWFLAATVAAVAGAGFAGADAAGPALLAAGVVYVTIGLFTAASYAFFMDIAERRFGGTQFSALMSATNACEAWSVRVSGAFASAHGFPAAFFLMAGVSAVAVPIAAAASRIRETTSDSRRNRM